jgi:hypothetical protein
VDLNLHYFVSICWIFNLGCNFTGFNVHSSLKQGLSVIKFIRCNIRIEFSKLIVVFGGLRIVLDIKITVSEERESSATARGKLKFIV